MTDENANRIATALERIADALERIPTITVGEFDLAACDDRTCTDRSHWAPRGPSRCEPGCVRPSLHGGDCEARVVADLLLCDCPDPVVTEAENGAGD